MTIDGETYELLNYTAALPAAPTLTLRTSGITVTASWDAAIGATWYDLFYATYPDGSVTGPVNMGNKTTFSVDLWEGAAYSVYLQACNNSGCSDYSNTEHFEIVSSLTVNPSTVTIPAGQTSDCTISSGTSPYSASSSDTSVATASVSGSTLSVKALGAGSATITVTDSTSDSATVSVTVPPPAVSSSKLPDTGQTKCYNWMGNEIDCPLPGEKLYGQDGNYTDNPPSYTKLDSSGNDLSDSATSWAMVRDNVTGLIWEVKTNDETINNKDDHYTWQDAANVFIETMNSSQFGGYTDWRLPAIKELVSILDYENPYPTIDIDYFPKTAVAPYWSSTASACTVNNAWYINFEHGNDYVDDKSRSYHVVRAVRGPQSDNTLVDNGDGTVTDTSTGLMWQQSTSNSDILPWTAALSYCENLTLAGYTDWRLPNIKELRTIVDTQTCNPAIDTEYFPDTMRSDYWSSTTREVSPSSAWTIDFSYGEDFDNGKTEDQYVRAVRYVTEPPP